MKFTKEEIEFMKSLGLNFDFNNLSDDEWVEIEDVVGTKYNDDGFDDQYYNNPNKIGLMCESILDKLND